MALQEQQLLDASDIRDLIGAIRGLTMAIRQEGALQRDRYEAMKKHDPFVQMLAAMKRIADGQDRLYAALTARIGNGHDTAAESERDHG